MKPHWLLLNDRDRDAVRTLMAFINGRLSERHIVDWALKAKPHEIVKRIAVLDFPHSGRHFWPMIGLPPLR